jgi:hypothetical protein
MVEIISEIDTVFFNFSSFSSAYEDLRMKLLRFKLVRSSARKL